ncbi:MAG: DUF2012 domain-containing protein [Armatimonadetes bacterium]|nr:DUF2012 domain-containing protein [Armatimonadota bacterium]
MRWLRATLAALAIGALVAGCGSSAGGGSGGNGRVTGRLTNAAGGTVRIEGTSLSCPVGADGSFSLPNVPPGEYTLSVTAPGNMGGAVLVRVVDGDATDVSQVELVEVGQIAGLVTNSATGQPIVGARISARLTPLMWAYGDATAPGVASGVDAANGSARRQATDNTDANRPPPRTAVTNSSGSYVLTGALVGPYSIEIAADGFEAAEVGTWVGAGTTATADAQLVPVDPNNASIEGTVTGTSEGVTGPLAAVRVDVWPVTSGDFPMPLANGSPARRSRQADPTDGTGTDTGGADTGGTDTGGTDTGGTDAGGADPGDVMTATGGGTTEELNNIDPWMVPPFWRGKSTMTDAQGHYSIANIVPGTYTVVFWRFGYQRVEQTVTFTAQGHQTVNTTMVSNLVHVSGTVRGRQASGSLVPIAGAWVNAYGNVYMPYAAVGNRPTRGKRVKMGADMMPPGGVAQTDENGRYTLDVEGGTVTVSAFADGYEWNSTTIEATSGTVDGVDLVLETYVPPVDGGGGGGGTVEPGNGFGTGGGYKPDRKTSKR